MKFDRGHAVYDPKPAPILRYKFIEVSYLIGSAFYKSEFDRSCDRIEKDGFYENAGERVELCNVIRTYKRKDGAK